MTKDQLREYVGKKFEGKMTLLDTGRWDPMYEVKPSDLLEIARALHDDENLNFNVLCNLGGIDTGERFEVLYNLGSTETKLRLDFKLVLPREEAEVDSVQEIWPGANWFEREMWELYGINVRNHGNLKRFLLPDDWDQGYPMRKDWDAPDFVRMPEL
jgi:NADH:ubiquinone oxidoreductase subunit C